MPVDSIQQGPGRFIGVAAVSPGIRLIQSARRCARAALIFALLWPCSGAMAGGRSDVGLSQSERVDSILVVKSERRLYLMREGQPLRSFQIALGLSPVGPKRQEFDFRTPEGHYVIDARRPNSRYFRALHVSYPNAEDLHQAAARHVSPGGDIMIHGLPNAPTKPLEYYQSRDWTNGCIALSNDDLLEVWAMVRERIPVEIRP